MGNHVHVNGVTVVVAAVSAVMIIGVMNLAAMKHGDNNAFWASWQNLYGVK